MDTFIDKLAQKLTAQEMIKANSAAEAAELNKTKMQVARYDELLREIRALNKINEESAVQVNKLLTDCMEKIEASSHQEKVNQLIDESLAKIAEIQKNEQSLEPFFTELTDHVHKENVKVYRNVQAVVVEEMEKVNTATANNVKAVSGKMNAVIGISIVALITSLAGVVFQLLVYLHII